MDVVTAALSVCLCVASDSEEYAFSECFIHSLSCTEASPGASVANAFSQRSHRREGDGCSWVELQFLQDGAHLTAYLPLLFCAEGV